MEQETNEIKVGDWVEFSVGALFLTFGQKTAQVIELGSFSNLQRVFFINKHGKKDWVPLEWCIKTDEKSALIKKLFSTLDDEESKP